MGKLFRFVHCADLHLGSRFKGLEIDDPTLARRLRESVFESFARIVDIAIDKQADALIISGDLYDDSNELPSTRLWLSQQFSRLSIPVYICRGNHDSETAWDSAIPYPKNVKEFGTEPEKLVLDDVEIIGVSYSTPHETRNLVSMIEGDPERFTIACVHCDIDSYSEGYPYAPCLGSDLQGRSVDYWALGHIHRRNVVSTTPYVVYPGNIQGRSFKETGEKGCYLITVDSGRIRSADFIPTQGFVWKDLNVNIAGWDLNDVVNTLKGSLNGSSLARVTFRGSGKLDTMLRSNPSDVSRAISDATGSIISSIVVDTSPEVDLDSRAGGKDMASAVIRTGDRFSSLSKDELLDIICTNKIAARYRDRYSALSEDELKNMVRQAVRNVIVMMEASR
ncbi:MAG: DNA repair exonuclease [Candidatus Methanomethylophilaceae archaeon]|nr:DNA repair exonuclease [Candidatus Methanomethylophilaceae archaeon]